jgi:trehalose-6-phosphate synthase
MPREDTQFGGTRDPGLDTRFKPGVSGNPPLKAAKRGVQSAISDPEYAKLVAEAVVAGLTLKQLSENFEISMDTARRWRRDPRIKAHALKMVEDRVIQITRKVDSVIEARLAHASEMSMKELLDIRKEYLGGALRTQTERGDDEVTSAAMDLLEQNPDLASKMVALLQAKGPSEESQEGEKTDIPVTTDEQ